SGRRSWRVAAWSPSDATAVGAGPPGPAEGRPEDKLRPAPTNHGKACAQIFGSYCVVSSGVFERSQTSCGVFGGRCGKDLITSKVWLALPFTMWMSIVVWLVLPSMV